MYPTKNSLDAVLKSRTVIPRWKPPHQAVETYSADKAQLLRRSVLGDPWIKHLEATFDQFPSPHTANELYETALLYGRAEDLPPSVKKQVEKLRDTMKWSCSNPEQDTFVLGDNVDVHETAARQEIRLLRRKLTANQNLPFCWSELARNFLIVGKQDKAVRCMQAALQLAKHNRYLCRAATRLFVHVKDPGQALYLLRSEPTIKSDPWLLAAEIATSSVIGKQSQFLDAAKRLMTSSDFKDNEITELAAAVGTVELSHGVAKHAKALFNRSLRAPTDNSLAQAQWAAERDTKIVIPVSAWKTPASYEAKTLLSRQARNWPDALQACAAWLTDEPFSIRPALIGSYIGFRPESYVMAEQFASAGLRCDPTNVGLLNNRAVARAYQGKIKEAYTDVRVALNQMPARDNPHLMATLGLIAFRSDMPDLGRECYKQCIAWFSDAKERSSVAVAILHLSREEIRIDRSSIPRSIEMAERITKLPVAMQQPEIIGMAELLLEEAHSATTPYQASHGLGVVAPASSNDIQHYASLFHVPDKAKQLALRLGDFSGIM